MATRADVARLAGVSAATVSYAISGKAPISEATRDRVFEAMRELRYTPHVMAQALAGRRSRIIAMLIPIQERGISNADMEYMLGAAEAARELGYHLLLWPTVDRDVEDVASLGQAGLLNGVILMEVRMEDERVGLLRDAGVPFALIGRTANPEAEHLLADRDFETAIMRAVEYLMSLGHRHIAFLNAPRKIVRQGLGAFVRAEAGFKAAAKRYGIKGVLLNCDASIPAGREFAKRVAADHPEVTALVELNAEAIVGFMQEAPNVGLDIPRGFSVVSVGVSDNLANATMPALTTIAPPANSMGRRAAELLIASVSEQDLPAGERLFVGELVVRDSSGPAPSADDPVATASKRT